MIGRTVCHYTILEKIGAGGMGEVYIAEVQSSTGTLLFELRKGKHCLVPRESSRSTAEGSSSL